MKKFTIIIMLLFLSSCMYLDKKYKLVAIGVDYREPYLVSDIIFDTIFFPFGFVRLLALPLLDKEYIIEDMNIRAKNQEEAQEKAQRRKVEIEEERKRKEKLGQEAIDKRYYGILNMPCNAKYIGNYKTANTLSNQAKKFNLTPSEFILGDDLQDYKKVSYVEFYKIRITYISLMVSFKDFSMGDFYTDKEAQKRFDKLVEKESNCFSVVSNN